MNVRFSISPDNSKTSEKNVGVGGEESHMPAHLMHTEEESEAKLKCLMLAGMWENRTIRR